MKFSNIWKAWLTTALGTLIPVVTGIVTDVMTGTTNWHAVGTALVPTAILLVTDLLNEVKSEFTATTDAKK